MVTMTYINFPYRRWPLPWPDIPVYPVRRALPPRSGESDAVEVLRRLADARSTPSWETGDGSASLSVDLPGFAPADIRVEVDSTAVRVSAESAAETRRRAAARFSTTLPTGADPDTLAAALERGVLTITVAILPTTRRVPVSGS